MNACSRALEGPWGRGWGSMGTLDGPRWALGSLRGPWVRPLAILGVSLGLPWGAPWGALVMGQKGHWTQTAANRRPCKVNVFFFFFEWVQLGTIGGRGTLLTKTGEADGNGDHGTHTHTHTHTQVYSPQNYRPSPGTTEGIPPGGGRT